MASGYRNSAGAEFDSLYDPDIIGDGPTATGFRKSDGSPLKYAAAKYGTIGPNVNYRLAGGADVSTLWAKKGSAVYTLPFDGVTYAAAEVVPASSQGSAQLTLILKTDGTFSVVKSTTHNGGGTLASGTWNTGGGAVGDYQAMFTVTNIGGTGPGSITNDAQTWASLSGQLTVSVALGPYGASSGSHDAEDTIRVQIRRAADGVVLTDSTCTFSVTVDGSV